MKTISKQKELFEDNELDKISVIRKFRITATDVKKDIKVIKAVKKINKLEELIEKFCPDGVEYHYMWELTAWDKKFNGMEKEKQKKVIPYKYYLSSDFNKVERENGNIKYISTGINSKERYTTEELSKEYLAEGEVICIPGGGTPNVKYHNGKFVTGDNRIATSLNKEVLDNKFLYYWMQSNIESLSSFYRGSGIQHPNMQKVLNMYIPVPPIEVQNEIVRILDNFTELIAELTAELTARKQQYEYYEHKLFFENNNKMIELEELCNISSGGTPSKIKSEYWDNGKIKWLGSTVCKNKKFIDEITGYITELGLQKSSAKLMKKNTTLIAMVGATIGKVAFLNFEATTNQNVACLYSKNDNKLNSSYLYYACKNLYPKFLEYSNGKFAIASLGFIKTLKIPVPSLKEQERIVSILDRFDKLCNDISQGLPAEIEARQKQYEYYRDKLLTFKELKKEN